MFMQICGAMIRFMYMAVMIIPLFEMDCAAIFQRKYKQLKKTEELKTECNMKRYLMNERDFLNHCRTANNNGIPTFFVILFVKLFNEFILSKYRIGVDSSTKI